MIPYVLTIGGSDSSGAVGIQADLKTFEARQVFGLSALTLVTAQNSSGIQSFKLLEPDFVLAQIRAVAETPAKAIKTGLLLNADMIRAVHMGIADQPAPLIVDPVLVAGDGRRLTDDATIQAYKDLLFPRAVLITPNIYEAELLTSLEIKTIADVRQAAKRFNGGAHAPCVLIKGGHLGNGSELVDVFYDGSTFHELRVERLPALNPRGAGDTYAACIAAEIAKGHDIFAAVQIAKEYLTAAIRAALTWQMGSGERGLLFHSAERPPLFERRAQR